MSIETNSLEVFVFHLFRGGTKFRTRVQRKKERKLLVAWLTLQTRNSFFLSFFFFFFCNKETFLQGRGGPM